MAIVYIINYTCPDTPAFALRPGEENGPGSGGVVTTSLSLFGMGAQRWGEGVDEDLLHLLENFAANPVDPVPRDGLSNITLAGTPYPDVYTPGDTWKDILNYPTTGQMWYNKVIEGMMLYDGTKWVKMRGANLDPTPDPVPGDLWLDEDFHAPHPSITCTAQLMIWDGTQWCSAADGYVRKSGDTMYGDLQMLDGTQHLFGDVGSEHLVINEGNGDPNVCPDIHKLIDDLLIASVGTLHLLFDSDGSGADEFQVRKGNLGGPGKNLLQSDWCLRVESDCTLSVNSNLDYETLVTDDDDIPNKKWVDDEIAALEGIYLRLDATNDPVTGTIDTNVDGNTAPALCGTGLMTISANNGILIIVDKDNNSTGTADPFRVMMDSPSLTGATGLMTVQQDGRVLVDTPNYETLVTASNVLTNKQYVDIAIDDGWVLRTGGATYSFPGERPVLVWGRDVIWNGSELLMTKGAGGGTEIIWPAQYTP